MILVPEFKYNFNISEYGGLPHYADELPTKDIIELPETKIFISNVTEYLVQFEAVREVVPMFGVVGYLG